jgi:hypothetical protein
MKKIFLPLLAVAALVAACVPSVNPFYFDKDTITDARLVGTWLEDSTKSHPDSWKFEASTTNTYAATLTDDDGKIGKFDAHLFKLGGPRSLTSRQRNVITPRTKPASSAWR